MNKKFIRNKEDFICEKCSAEVIGSGYTNHCPVCLWSMHVDVNPGDREATCRGLMNPISIDKKDGIFRILHKCAKCGYKKFNKAEKNDNIEEIINISKKNVTRS